jgi:cardiolipin synthase (CMP-forming)
MKVQQTEVQTDRVLTIPNAISCVRLLTIPVFMYLALVEQADGAAALVLVLGGISDFLDGYLARRWSQISRVGQLLDPVADRLSTLAVMVVFLVRSIVPWWFVLLLVGRDIYLAIQVGRLKKLGITGVPVNFVGKAATFYLLMSFPLLLWGSGTTSGIAALAWSVGVAMTIWGAGLYYYSAWLYQQEVRGMLAGSVGVA